MYFDRILELEPLDVEVRAQAAIICINGHHICAGTVSS
jgi:hypothetical protein